MRWLHLTDLHIGWPNNQATDNAIASALEDIEILLESKPVDYVFLTGDLVWSGQTHEYDEFRRLVIAPIRRSRSLANAKLFIVPGNHDLDCNATLPVDWGSLGSRRQELFFAPSEDARTLRSPRARAFSNFSTLLDRDLLGVDPISAIVQSHEICTPVGVVQVICLNTAILCDKELQDEGKIPAPTPALRQVIDASKGPYAHRVVLGHHPIRWFAINDQEPFKGVLARSGALYLHGHTHKIEVVATRSELLGLGFGAGYQSSLDHTRASHYKNMYALCEIDATGLHTVFRSWDNGNGRWVPHHQLPNEFRQRSPLYPDGYVLSLGGTSSTVGRRGGSSPVVTALQMPGPSVTRVVVPGEIASPAVFWRRHLSALQLGDLDLGAARFTEEVEANRATFTARRGDMLVRIRCIGAPGHVMSEREIEAENTRMDADQVDQLYIVSLGTISNEAQSLSQLLSRRKYIRVLGQSDICRAYDSGLPDALTQHVKGLDASFTCILVLEDALTALAVTQIHGNRTFYALDSAGRVLEESDPLVCRLREHPEFASKPYQGSLAVTSPLEENGYTFELAAYLSACSDEFRTIRYAPLASIGLRFPNAAIADVYIPASAERAGADEESSGFREALNDLLDTLHLDDAQRAALESQLRSGSVFSSASSEIGAARELYQQYGNVLLLGDPGSGKTCFVKNEILSYCQGPESAESWYRRHVPIYVSLAEVGQILSESAENCLLDACATLAQRRGLRLTRRHIDTLLQQGLVAFFFDGLDEVFALDIRTRIVEAIDALISVEVQHGNRFTLTSRPAATQIVQIPSRFMTLHLRGFTDREMRTLAKNLLRVEKSTASHKPVDECSVSAEDEKLVDTLLKHCADNPSIRRMARNPLLLTLLVMIYANSGPLAAKRHRIYDQAVQTLVSVRNRVSGQPVLSEADLRRRLGAVALGIFRSSMFGIPQKTDVLALLRAVVRRERGFSSATVSDDAVAQEAHTFLQRVSELTGLIVIHNRGHERSETISFLHHSFLEYYAAIGLLEEGLNLEQIDQYADYPRWQEVYSIISGILGDSPGTDVAAFLSAIVSSSHPSEVATQDRLLLGFDCALECDVPPQESQAFFVAEVEKSVSSGAARVDSELRKELSKRLVRLFQASGNKEIVAMLRRGFTVSNDCARAAFVDLAGLMRIGENFAFDRGVVEGFEQLRLCRDRVTRVAYLNTLRRVPEFRTPKVLESVSHCFSESFLVRYVACRTAASVDGLPTLVREELLQCVSDRQAAVAHAAAEALMQGGMVVDLSAVTSRRLLEQCLRRWERMASSGNAMNLRIALEKDDVVALLTSPQADDRVLGLRLTPWLSREDVFVYDLLVDVVKRALSEMEKSDTKRTGELGEDRRHEVVAALASLRFLQRLDILGNVKGADALTGLLRIARHRDLRIGSCRALSVFPADSFSVDALIAFARSARREEFREAVRALVQHAPENNSVQRFLFEETLLRLRPAASGGFGDDSAQRDLERLVESCEELELADQSDPDMVRLRTQVVGVLWNVSQSYKTPRRMRRDLLLAYSFLETDGVRGLSRLIGLLKCQEPTLRECLGRAVGSIMHTCRQRVDSVREILSMLPEVESALLMVWRPASAQDIDDDSMCGIRSAIRSVRALRSAYDEFSAMRRPTGTVEVSDGN